MRMLRNLSILAEKANNIGRSAAILIVSSLFLAGSLQAQDSQIETAVTSLTDDPVTEFVRPLADAVGASLNGGWLCSAPDAEKQVFSIRIGLVGMGAFIDPDQEIFQVIDALFPFQDAQSQQLAQSIDGFGNLSSADQQAIIDVIRQTDFRSDVSGPTVFGDENASVVATVKEQTINVNGTDFTVPAQTIALENATGLLQDPGIFPTIAPQLTIGTFYGTAVTARYIPKTNINGDFGDLEYLGYGLSHNPAVWFADPLPFNISLGYYRQNVNVGGEILDVTTDAYGVNISKEFGGFKAGLTPYIGYQREKSTLKADYDYELFPGVVLPIDVEIEAANQNRYIAGLGFTLFGANVFADYNFSELQSVNVAIQYGL